MTRLPTPVVELRRALGLVLSEFRESASLNQSDLARLTHYSRTSICHIEAGRQFPGQEFWQTVDQALGAHGELLSRYDHAVEVERKWKISQLGRGRDVRTAPLGHRADSSGSLSCPPASSQDWQDDVNRRELFRMIALAGTMLTIPVDDFDADRIAHSMSHPARLDSTTLDELDKLNSYLWRHFSQSRSKRDALPVAIRQLSLLNDALKSPQEAEGRRQLSRLTSDLLQLCGEVFFDGDNYADAAHCYSMAAHASREARDFDLWACAMTRHAFLSIYESRHENAAPLLDGAARIAKRGDSARATRYWVSAVQAQAYAGLGDVISCRKALDFAHQVADLGYGGRTSGWLRFEGSRLAEEQAACFVTLELPDLAEPALKSALTKDVSTRRRGSVLTDLAVIGTQRQSSDEIVLHGAAALDTFRQTSSNGFVGRKLIGLRGKLGPFLNDRHVRFLASQIDETIFVNASGNKERGDTR